MPGILVNGTRAGESQRGCSPGRAGGYMITKEGDSFKTWMSPQFKSSLSAKKIKAQDCWFLRDGDRQTKGYP